ncbi:hypothetical protein F5144DRAFT_221595 [Chaetomium tenue]|uniref:Uncharacterized protein n=1 Tax=Chaetomium tenue TaxID=1854479 RepID=A0ACB7P5H0_9PEZI|nr:hypothetical protein F5144DRAFT_221595 [Chaetomium globosum]
MPMEGLSAWKHGTLGGGRSGPVVSVLFEGTQLTTQPTLIKVDPRRRHDVGDESARAPQGGCHRPRDGEPGGSAAGRGQTKVRHPFPARPIGVPTKGAIVGNAIIHHGERRAQTTMPGSRSKLARLDRHRGTGTGPSEVASQSAGTPPSADHMGKLGNLPVVMVVMDNEGQTCSESTPRSAGLRLFGDEPEGGWGTAEGGNLATQANTV